MDSSCRENSGVAGSMNGHEECSRVGVPASIPAKAILVVDDEPTILEILVEVLQSDGYEVDTALDGQLAFKKLRKRAYDVILSDMRMPQLDGVGLYREIAQHAPQLLGRVIFLTGDILGSETQEFLERTGVPWLQKPFGLQDIRQVVWEVLRVGKEC